MEGLKKFMEMASEDKKLKERILEINNECKSPEENKEKLIKLAKEYGIVLKKEDFVPKNGLLDDSALEAACGGGACLIIGVDTENKCGCFLAGGGSGDDYISCVVGGI